MIRNAVIHLSNEQPLLADLFDVPSASDVALVCTNLRTMNGKRPVFVDQIDSVFVFPFVHIRFVEIPPGARGELVPATPERAAAGEPGPESGPATEPGPGQEPEADLEIDEDFLRRVREV